MRLMLTTTLGLALLSTVGFAATQPQTPSTTGQSMTGQTAQNVPQELQQKLTDQGFSDVKVVPDSFLVSAKDKQGYPVTMLIGPNSLTVFTMVQDHRQAKGEQPKQ
ncbi:MAG: hypothetical protein WBS22_06695 [Methylocystis sp.]